MVDPVTATVGSAVAGVGSSLIGSRSANRAADAQTRAAQDQMVLQEQIYSDQVSRFEPFYGAGQNALAAYLYEMGLAPQPDGYDGISMSPQAQFALREGISDIEAGAAARGGLVSGSTAQALEDYRTNLALADRDTQLNRLAAMAQGGQAAAGLIGNAGTNFAAMGSNALGSIGNAQAAGAIGTGNALAGGINNLNQALTFGYQAAQNPFAPQPAAPGIAPLVSPATGFY